MRKLGIAAIKVIARTMGTRLVKKWDLCGGTIAFFCDCGDVVFEEWKEVVFGLYVDIKFGIARRKEARLLCCLCYG